MLPFQIKEQHDSAIKAKDRTIERLQRDLQMVLNDHEAMPQLQTESSVIGTDRDQPV